MWQCGIAAGPLSLHCTTWHSTALAFSNVGGCALRLSSSHAWLAAWLDVPWDDDNGGGDGGDGESGESDGGVMND